MENGTLVERLARDAVSFRNLVVLPPFQFIHNEHGAEDKGAAFLAFRLGRINTLVVSKELLELIEPNTIDHVVKVTDGGLPLAEMDIDHGELTAKLYYGVQSHPRLTFVKQRPLVLLSQIYNW